MIVLMSFKPLFAQEIVEGRKRCEVRTFFTPLKPGVKVFVYASTPLKSIVGEFNVGKIMIYDNYPELMQALSKFCKRLSKENLRFIVENYSSTKRKLILFEIANPMKYNNFITLSTLRKYLGTSFNPPRSYVVIHKGTNLYKVLASLKALIKS